MRKTKEDSLDVSVDVDVMRLEISSRCTTRRESFLNSFTSI